MVTEKCGKINDATMNKVGLAVGILILGIIGIFIISNQMQNINQETNAPSPTTISYPSATPAQTGIKQQKISNTAVIKTSKGDIALTLFPNDAPNTVANFIEKAKSGFYNNLTFHRVEDWVIQGGDPLGTGTGGGDMPTELNNKPFVVGSLGVARGKDIKISNDAQFFITKTDASWLNKQYTNFGIVTNSMDVVKNIEIGDKILEITTE